MFSLRNSLLILTAVFFTACAPKTITKEVIVKVPVKCEVEIPKRPERVKNASENVVNILEYTEKLEALVEMCVNGEKEVKLSNP